MNFPLLLSFKLMSIRTKLFVRDESGAEVCFVRKKSFKLREHVKVYSDSSQDTLVCEIRTNKILDFSAAYVFTDPEGNEFGSVRRKGMRSIFKAHYEITEGDTPVMLIDEENGWVKVLDGLLGELPLIGPIFSYFLNPSYLVTRANGGTPAFRLAKQPAFWEGKFVIEKLDDVASDEEMRVVVGLLMVVLLERARG